MSHARGCVLPARKAKALLRSPAPCCLGYFTLKIWLKPNFNPSICITYATFFSVRVTSSVRLTVFNTKNLYSSISNSIQRRNIFYLNRKPDPMSSFHPLAALFVAHVAVMEQSPCPLREQTVPFSVLMWRLLGSVGKIWVATCLQQNQNLEF